METNPQDELKAYLMAARMSFSVRWPKATPGISNYWNSLRQRST